MWYKELPKAVYGPTNIEEGLVVCGHRHTHAMHIMIALTGKRSVKTEVGENESGFLTDTNRFVDRVEGAEIALKCGQIEKLNYHSTKLFSEDLY